MANQENNKNLNNDKLSDPKYIPVSEIKTDAVDLDGNKNTEIKSSSLKKKSREDREQGSETQGIP